MLVAPGAYLGAEHHLRIAVGYEPEKLKAALSGIGAAVGEIVTAAAS